MSNYKKYISKINDTIWEDDYDELNNNYTIQKEYNGKHVIVMIEKNEETTISVMDEEGNNIMNLSHLYTDLMDFYNNSFYNNTSIIIDGVVCKFITEDERIYEEYEYVDNYLYTTEENTDNDVELVMFDIMTLNEFVGIDKSMNYNVRYDSLFKSFVKNKYNKLRVPFSIPYNRQICSNLYNKEVCVKRGWKGLIARKKDIPYQDNNLIKRMKPLNYAKVIITDIIIDNESNIKLISKFGPTENIEVLVHDWDKNIEFEIGKEILITYRTSNITDDNFIEFFNVFFFTLCAEK